MYPKRGHRLLTAVVTAFVATLALLPLRATPAGAEELRIVFPSMWNEAVDPMLSSSSGCIGLAAMYDDLIGVTPDGTELSKETGIANDWSMSADGKEWTIKIRKGVMFHRGFGELTAEDVKFSLDRLSSERSVAQEKAYFRNQIQKVEVIDPYTVKVTGKRPIPDLLVVLSAMRGSTERFMVSQKAVQKLGEDGFAKTPVGTGPYEFVSRVGGQNMQFKAVENHWRIGKPRFDTLKFLAVPEEESSIAMVQRGDADLVPISRANIKRLEAAKVRVMVQEGLNSVSVFMDDQFVDTVPVHNEKVREALNLAIDRNAIAQSIFDGHARPMGTYYTQIAVLKTLGYDWKADLYSYDPAKAKQLLKEAGYPNGFDIDVYIYPWTGLPEGPDTMQAIAGMWNQIGVRTKIIPTEYGVVRAKLLKGEIPGATGYFQAPARPWQGEVGVYRIFMHSKGAFNHVKIPELDAFLDAAAEALDPNVIKHKLAEAMHYIRNHHLAVPVLEFDQAFAVTNKLDKWKPVFLPQDLNFDTMFKR
jgi:peptide/nickel transport system substrate-binding protein